MLKKWHLIQIIQLLFGTAILAFAIVLFLVPNQLSSGGFSGIAIVLHYLFNSPVGITVFILNTPLFILAGFRLRKKVFNKCCYWYSIAFCVYKHI